MGAVSGGEGVVDIGVGQLGQAVHQSGVVLFFACVVTGVLQQ
jgi:Ethanolamine utilization protein EutJ (predicted chaperonin)